MIQTIIEIVGLPKRLCQGCRNVVAEAAKSIRVMKWARVAELEMDGRKDKKYP